MKKIGKVIGCITEYRIEARERKSSERDLPSPEKKNFFEKIENKKKIFFGKIENEKGNGGGNERRVIKLENGGGGRKTCQLVLHSCYVCKLR